MLRNALARNATRIGLLLEDLQNSTPHAKFTPTQLKIWGAFLLAHSTDTSALQEILTGVLPLIEKDVLAAKETETCDASSSMSDYSDSRTVSSDGESSRRRRRRSKKGEEKEGEEEEGEEEDSEEGSEDESSED